MSKRCVVSFADTPFYQQKMERLKESLKGNFDGDFIGFTSVDQVGAKPHSIVPYAFKPYSIQKAIDMGYDSILWVDSPIVAIKDITPVFEHIEEHGYLFFNNYGHPLGKWINDKALSKSSLTREQAMNVKQIMACCMGFNFKRTNTSLMFMAYLGCSDELYPGSWDNHRHDQSVASVLINEMNLDIQEGHKSFFIYEHFKEVPEFQPISESVCLISR